MRFGCHTDLNGSCLSVWITDRFCGKTYGFGSIHKLTHTDLIAPKLIKFKKKYDFLIHLMHGTHLVSDVIDEVQFWRVHQLDIQKHNWIQE